MLTGNMKTYDGWKGSLTEYLQIGDRVDTEMKDYFINVLPPATQNSHCIQMGEPYESIEGKMTYSTLKKMGHDWVYAGHCHKGKTEPPQMKYKVKARSKFGEIARNLTELEYQLLQQSKDFTILKVEEL